MGLDKNGFKRKNYAEIFAETEVKAREFWGDDINTTERSSLGIFLRLFSWGIAKVWELAEKVYNSAFITKAEGVQMDNLTPYYNTKRNKEQAATVTLAFTGTPNYTITAGKQFVTQNDIYFTLTENVTLNSSGNGAGRAVSMDVGIVGNVPAGTITVQSEPDSSVSSVTNPDAAIGGRDYETDAELLSRLLDSSAGNGSGTANAIRAAILAVPGVRAATVIENYEDVAVNGNDPKSIHAYVLGGDSQDIAEAIFSKKAAGIKPMGSEVVAVTDDSGEPQLVRFDFAVQVPIYIEVDATTNVSFPVDGVRRVQDEIIKVIGGTANDGTIYVGSQMGEDVYISQITRAVLTIPGIIDASVRIGKTSGSLGTTNIVIGNNEVAQTDPAKVTVI